MQLKYLKIQKLFLEKSNKIIFKYEKINAENYNLYIKRKYFYIEIKHQGFQQLV